jgi:hypothetical protein
MGMDLIARNRRTGDLHLFHSVWSKILEETGCGYLLGYGKSFTPGYYVYDSDRGSPVSNDGMKISASDAAIMSRLCEGYVFVKTFLQEEWDKLSDKEKEYTKGFFNITKDPNYPNLETDEFLEKVKQFSDFAKRSGGFKIY